MFSGGFIGGNILAAGQRTGGTADVGGKWKKLQPMNTPRIDHACVVYQQEVWAIGGWTDTVEIYNFDNNTWRYGPELPKDSYWISMDKGQAIVHNAQVYVIFSDGQIYQHENGWKNVATIGQYVDRPVFPAPIVTKKILNC